MSFEIIPSHTDDWGEQQPDRVVGTGETEAAAWRTARRRLCSTAEIHLVARCRVREIIPPPPDPPIFAESETLADHRHVAPFQRKRLTPMR
jgi:hypothetical protein